MENKVLKTDICELVLKAKYFEELKGTNILITGCTGLLGSILVKSLIKFGNIKVYAACRNPKKFQAIFEDYLCENLVPIYSDITDLSLDGINIDYIVHGASITDSKTFVDKPVETIEIAIDGTRNILRQCVGKNIKGFVYLSSLEVYGNFIGFDGIKNVKEYEAGYIDSMAVRSSYSEGKRMTENICKAYQSEYNVPVKVARLCQTFGAGVEYNDNRVFAQFARSIIESRDIILKTKGETVRNYCYTIDAVTGILTVLLYGQVGEVYNIANKNTVISIADMAKKVCELFPDSDCHVKFDLTEDVAKLGYNPVVRLSLDTEKLSTLGWAPSVDLEDMYKRLIDSMRTK